jgi:predicted histone-like DNA-binding protein
MLNLFFNVLLAIFYKLIKRKNPRDLTAPEKYYAKVVFSGKVTLKELAPEISENITINAVEIEASIRSLGPAIKRHLAQGQIVEIEGIGTCYPSVSSSGADTEEAFNANTHIRDIYAVFRPTADTHEAVNKAGLTRK